MTIKEAINQAVIMLKNENIDAPKNKARMLLEATLKKSKEYLIIYDNKEITPQEREAYIKNEALGQSKLNKIAREMVFKYCTFSKKYRESLASNPQYQSLIERFNIKKQSKEHSLALIARKVTAVQEELPKEMQDEIAFAKL